MGQLKATRLSIEIVAVSFRGNDPLRRNHEGAHRSRVEVNDSARQPTRARRSLRPVARGFAAAMHHRSATSPRFSHLVSVPAEASSSSLWFSSAVITVVEAPVHPQSRKVSLLVDLCDTRMSIVHGVARPHKLTAVVDPGTRVRWIVDSSVSWQTCRTTRSSCEMRSGKKR